MSSQNAKVLLRGSIRPSKAVTALPSQVRIAHIFKKHVFRIILFNAAKNLWCSFSNHTNNCDWTGSTAHSTVSMIWDSIFKMTYNFQDLIICKAHSSQNTLWQMQQKAHWGRPWLYFVDWFFFFDINFRG